MKPPISPDAYRNSLLTVEQVRAATACPRCGVRAGVPCEGTTGNHIDRVRRARSQRVASKR